MGLYTHVHKLVLRIDQLKNTKKFCIAGQYFYVCTSHSFELKPLEAILRMCTSKYMYILYSPSLYFFLRGISNVHILVPCVYSLNVIAAHPNSVCHLFVALAQGVQEFPRHNNVHLDWFGAVSEQKVGGAYCFCIHLQ